MFLLHRSSNITALLLAFAFSSCNVVKMVERKNERHLHKLGYTCHAFKGPGGDHFVRYRDTGKPKLMLLHGITGTGLSQWTGNADSLGRHFDLIIPDLLGHGHSHQNWAGNSVIAQVEHLRLLLDSLGVNEPVHLVGNSYGGAIAANFAERHGDRVRTLVIYDGPASDYTRTTADSVARSRGAADIRDLLAPTDKEGQRRAIAVAFHRPPKLPGFAYRQYNKTNILPYRQSFLRLLDDLLAREAEYATKAYVWKMPVYVLWGANDGLIPVSTGMGIMRRSNVAGDHWIVLSDCGHIANREKPDEFNAVLLRILK